MNFSQALEAVKKGLKITRKGWNGKGLWVELQRPDEHSKMTRPYMYIVSPKGSTSQFGESVKDFERVPWLASQTDLLAEDWATLAETSLANGPKTLAKTFAYRSTLDSSKVVYREHPFGANGAYKRAPEMDKVKQ